MERIREIEEKWQAYQQMSGDAWNIAKVEDACLELAHATPFLLAEMAVRDRALEMACEAGRHTIGVSPDEYICQAKLEAAARAEATR